MVINEYFFAFWWVEVVEGIPYLMLIFIIDEYQSSLYLESRSLQSCIPTRMCFSPWKSSKMVPYFSSLFFRTGPKQARIFIAYITCVLYLSLTCLVRKLGMKNLINLATVMGVRNKRTWIGGIAMSSKTMAKSVY